MSSYKQNQNLGTERKIDWEDVENKVSIICRKFSNIDNRYQDDLAQELRIHAYYVSDDYYDLQRKAIDYWRTLTRRVYPEVPYIDLELMAGADSPSDGTMYYESTVKAIRKELNRKVYDSKTDSLINGLALKILDILIEDIDGSTLTKESIKADKEIGIHKYRNGKINISYLDLRFPDVNYKTITKAVNRLKEVITGLEEMGSI